MGERDRVQQALSDLEVSNVFLYVGDAVRDDFLPQDFTRSGTYVRTIASSTHSPSSFASLCTGRYPPAHGVTSFNDVTPANAPNLLNTPGFETQFLNSIFAYATRKHGRETDPIYSVLDWEPPGVDSPFQGIEPPFLAVERGPGGHAPYGDFSGTATEYFKRRGRDRQTVVDDYRRSIELDMEWFNRRVKELEERNLLDDTLVIYTSDHGEFLGERGVLGHNGPMSPELVYVPTVFNHEDLPALERPDTSLHHVDILPTVWKAVAADFPSERVDGKPFQEYVNYQPRPCFWGNRLLPDSIPGVSGRLSYEGVWDSGGGHVWTDSSRRSRLAILAAKATRGSKRSFMRANLRACLELYWWNERTYGDPSFDRQTGEDIIERAHADAILGRQTELSDEEKERLKDLGYIV